MKIRFLSLVFASSLAVGCGSQDTVIPTDRLTDAQKAAIVAEDKAVADEESQGKNPGQKKLVQRK